MQPCQSNSSPTALRLLALQVCVAERLHLLQPASNQCLMKWLPSGVCCCGFRVTGREGLIFFSSATFPCTALSNSYSFLLLEGAPYTCTQQLLCYAEISPLCVQPALEKDHVGSDGLVNIINDAS